MSTRKSIDSKLMQKTVFTAILSALIMIMTFTGFGYIPIGPLKLTINVVPVAVAAIVLGWQSGLFVGGVFGLSSFITCFTTDAFGAVLISINPFYTLLMCVVPRLLCGLIPALICKIKINKNILIPIASVFTAIINTVGFLLLLWLFFGQPLANDPRLVEMFDDVGVNGLVAIFATFAGVNAIVEAASALVIGSAVSGVALKVWNKE